MSSLTTITFGIREKEKIKETNKKKAEKSQRARSLEEDKSRTP
jgi:hypothetical protein